MSRPTASQAKALFALDRVIRSGDSPSVRIVACEMGVSIRTAHKHLLALARQGLVWHERGERDWELTGEGVRKVEQGAAT